MTAIEALQTARAAGVEVALVGDNLVLEAASPPPSCVLDALSCNKAGIVALLRSWTNGWSAEDWIAFFEERAAIGQFDGGHSREQAEALAFSCCVAEWLNQNPAASDPDSCAWCRQPDMGMHAIVPFNANGIQYTWLRPECWGDWHAARKRKAIAALLCAGLPVSASPVDIDHLVGAEGGCSLALNGSNVTI